MKFMETRRYEMLVRVRDFGAENRDRFPAASLAGKTFALIATTVNELAEFAAIQIAAQGTSKATAKSKASARRILRQHLEKIRRTGQVIAHDIPDLERKFQFPKRGDQKLIAASRAFREYAAPVAAAFVRHELPSGFLRTLKDNVEEFERSIGEYDKSKNARAASTREIEAATARGVAAARRLDVIVRNKMHGDDAVLAAWDRTFRLLHIPRPNPKPAPPATEAPPVPAG